MKAVPSANRGFVLVLATTEIEEASSFYIYHTDDESHPHEFQIVWKGDARSNDADTATSATKLKGETTTKRYLMAPVSFLGRNEGPLRLESYGLLSDGIFSLNSVLLGSFFEGSENIPTKGWLNGNESCLIRCARRRWCFDGFLAVKRVQFKGQNSSSEQPQPEYITCCEGAPRKNDDGNLFMAFRLLKKSLWDDAESSSEHSHSQATATPSVSTQSTAAGTSKTTEVFQIEETTT